MVDKKITDLDALTGALVLTDLMEVARDPGGTPLSEKSTFAELVTLLNASFAGKETIWVPAAAMLPATTLGAAEAQLETTTNKLNYKVLDFDATADEFACFDVAFPKSWNEGTVTFQAFWESAGAVTTGIAVAVQGVFVSDNVTTDTAYGTAVVVTDDAQGAAAELYVTAESSAVTISGTPAVDGVVNFRVFRDVSDGNDDMTQDMRLRGIKVFFTTDVGNDA